MYQQQLPVLAGGTCALAKPGWQQVSRHEPAAKQPSGLQALYGVHPVPMLWLAHVLQSPLSLLLRRLLHLPVDLVTDYLACKQVLHLQSLVAC